MEAHWVQIGHISEIISSSGKSIFRKQHTFRSEEKSASPVDFDNENHGMTNNQTFLAVIS